jgi:L-ascorbate metabolism protein UlaG (beta-lactamase superfamily)
MLAGTAATAAVTGGWLSTSDHRAARWLRRIVADTRRRVSPAPVTPDPLVWSDNDVTVCWIGHATVLINFYGVHILTDPAFNDRVGVWTGVGTLGPKRYVAPAMRLPQLPQIDLLLLSHAHMDHMDIGSLRFFDENTKAITARDTRDVLESTRLKNVDELGWGQRAMLRTAKGDLEIEAFEVKHWGQRWPEERERGYNGYVLRREGKALLFGGDTAHTPLFSKLRSRGPFEVAMMPIGAYDPWIWNHCTPEEAVEMANLASARYIAPIHHQAFRLSREPMEQPLQRFLAALDGEPERIALRRVGEHFVCPRT